jgi:phosphohistidine phosphatase SixA
VGLLLSAPVANAQQALSGAALVSALQRGGYVLVVRHASSPREVPDARSANADNTGRERQLEENGRTTAKAMGEALRRLRIPIGAVWTSPTYRAQETARVANLPNPHAQPELGDSGQSMQGVTPVQTDWLKRKATEFPRGTNALLLTHMPNMSAAFPQWTEGLADGETLVLGPDGKGGAMLVARIKIEQWPHLGDQPAFQR